MCSQTIKETVRHLRFRSTNAERALWKELRNRRTTVLKWRRQYPITVADGDIERTFIADFYCVQKKLAIEIDGSVHATQREYDDARTAAIEALGIIVVRITNDDVLNDMQSVLERIMTIVG